MVRKFEGHTDKVQAVAMSRDANYVGTRSLDGAAILWDAATAKILQTFKEHGGGAALSGDGKLVLTWSEGRKEAILWDAASGTKLQTLKGHTVPIQQLVLSRDGKYALTGSDDKTAILWQLNVPPPLAKKPGPWQPLLDAKLSQWWVADNKQTGLTLNCYAGEVLIRRIEFRDSNALP